MTKVQHKAGDRIWYWRRSGAIWDAIVQWVDTDEDGDVVYMVECQDGKTYWATPDQLTVIGAQRFAA